MKRGDSNGALTIIPRGQPAVEPLNHGEPGVASTALTELRKYADTRLWKAEAKRQHAIAATVAGKEAVAEAMLEWRIAEERLEPENIARMKRAVADETRALETEAELRSATATHQLALSDLKQQAEEAELRERIAKAKLNQKKWEKKLDGGFDDDSLAAKIKRKEREKQDLMDEYADVVAASGGTVADYQLERDYERKLHRLNEELDALYEQLSQEAEDT